MRTTNTTRFAWHLAKKEPPRRRPGQAEVSQEQRQLLWYLFYGAAFLVGYLGGLVYGRGRDDGFGVSLAAYSLTASQYQSYAHVFGSLFGAAFLQITAIFLLGFSALGAGLLSAFFLAKGAFCGIGAAGVYYLSGAKGLIVHWLISSLPDLFLLLVLLWLALRAKTVAVTLYHSLQNTSRSRSPLLIGKIFFGYGLALLLAALLCLLGAALSVIIAGVLL